MQTDVLVIGGGPAGLTAAIYLARFHLDVIVIDKGHGRAASIPLSRNHAGFPDGIAGAELVARMREQAARYGARLRDGEVTALRREGDGFAARAGATGIAARAVLLATGVVNHRPAMDDATHDAALRAGLLRYCPICDGYEVTDKRVAVIGTGERGVKEALFLRGYTADLTLIAPGAEHDIDPADARRLDAAGIVRHTGPCAAFRLRGDAIEVDLPAGTFTFASLYPALGSAIRSELAAGLGAERSGEGCVLADAHQRTGVPGLYAAGDVVLGLDQISNAMGQGGVAATTIRNDLDERSPLRRDATAISRRSG